MAGDGAHALLVLGFESAGVTERRVRALAICRAHGGAREGEGARRARGARRSCARRTCATRWSRWACSSETFETAITWDRCRVRRDGEGAPRAEALGRGRRHLPAHARLPGRRGAVLHGARPGAARRGGGAVGAIKRAAADAILAAGGTITHHHAVGRDHRPWYDRQRPEPFAAALRAAKAALDPAGAAQPRGTLGAVRTSTPPPRTCRPSARPRRSTTRRCPWGGNANRGPPVVVRPRADRLGGGRRHLRARRRRRREGRDRDDARDLRRRARRGGREEAEEEVVEAVVRARARHRRAGEATLPVPR